MGELEGRVAIVTGGSRGIGQGIAARLLAEGARVVITGRKEATLAAAAAAMEPGGERVLPVVAHNGETESLERLVEATLARFERIDLLVNNAATNPHFGPVMDCPEWAWDKIFDVSLKGYFFLSTLVARHLRERKASGAIVNLASIAGLSPALTLGVYGIAKAGVIMMTKTFAQEWGGFGIRVNAVAPGVVPTALSQLIVHTPEIRKKVEADTPLGRLGTIDEVVEAVLFLLSDRSRYTTGHVLTVDGGTVLY